eukprot:1058034-Pelagomonas_calceolata.AAC.2
MARDPCLDAHSLYGLEEVILQTRISPIPPKNNFMHFAYTVRITIPFQRHDFRPSVGQDLDVQNA